MSAWNRVIPEHWPVANEELDRFYADADRDEQAETLVSTPAPAGQPFRVDAGPGATVSSAEVSQAVATLLGEPGAFHRAAWVLRAVAAYLDEFGPERAALKARLLAHDLEALR